MLQDLFRNGNNSQMTQNDAQTELLQAILNELKEQKLLLAGLMSEKVNKPSSKKPLNIREASEYLNIPKSTLYGYVQKKRVPFTRLNGKILFIPADLDNFLEINKQVSKKEEIIKAKNEAFKAIKFKK